jgi:hypothetical protein
MTEKYLGVFLFLVAVLVLAASGDLGALPFLLPCAALAGYLIVRYSGPGTALSLSRRKR